MTYFESPNHNYDNDKPLVFMAGGITGCPDWQQELKGLLEPCNATFANPRRADFPIGDPDAAQGQIEWEFQYLTLADVVLFWFPCETLCPIVLFELGAHAYSMKKIFVGTHPDYKRKQDVEVQLLLKRPDVIVVDNLEALADQVKQYLGAIRR